MPKENSFVRHDDLLPVRHEIWYLKPNFFKFLGVVIHLFFLNKKEWI